MKNYFLIIVGLFSLCTSSCSGQPEFREKYNVEIKTVNKFLTFSNDVKNINQIFAILGPSKMTRDTFNIENDIGTLSLHYKKGYLPVNEEKWTFDSLSNSQFVNISVPLMNSKGSSSRIASVTFSFDKTKHYVPDSIIVYYMLKYDFSKDMPR